MAKPELSPHERLAATLAHDEPDRVPFDFAATGLTGLRVEAQDALLRHFEIDDVTERLRNPALRIAEPHEALIERYPPDVAGALVTEGVLVPEDDEGEARYEWRVTRETARAGADNAPTSMERAEDAWGVRWERRGVAPTFQPVTAPLAGDIPVSRVESYDLPDPTDPRRWTVRSFDETRPTILGGFGPGLFETALLLRGRADVLRDVSTQTGVTEPLLDRLTELKMTYWGERLAEKDASTDSPALLLERERLDLLVGMPMDVATFRRLLRPRWERLFRHLKSLAPTSGILFFCQGYGQKLLGDFIDMGVTAVNLLPATVLDAKASFIKREYGDDLTFWGGGLWTAEQFLRGSEAEAADQVKAALDVFAPDGGFVWCPSPVIDADIPPANVARALDTLFIYGLY